MTDEKQLEPGWGLYQDEANEWRWRYVSPHNGNILAVSSEGYHNEEDAQASMDAVKLAGAVATSLEHPVEPTELTATFGPELPDPLPSEQQAAAELNAAVRGMNVAEANLSHGTDENMVRYSLEYLAAEQRLDLATSVVEAIKAERDAADPGDVSE